MNRPPDFPTPALANGHATPGQAAAEVPPAPQSPATRLLLSLTEAAYLLNVSEPTLKRRVADGDLPGRCLARLGRRRLFVRAALEEWANAGCPAPARRPRR
jgi:excisionase family DNA binding protein